MRENTIKKPLHIRCFNERAVQVAAGRQQSFAVTVENGELCVWVKLMEVTKNSLTTVLFLQNLLYQ